MQARKQHACGTPSERLTCLFVCAAIEGGELKMQKICLRLRLCLERGKLTLVCKELKCAWMLAGYMSSRVADCSASPSAPSLHRWSHRI